MSTPTRISRKAFAFEAGSEDYGKGCLPTCLEEGLFIGTGIGLRYITPTVPCDWTSASPLDRRPAVDDVVQIHVSIGQVF